MEAFVLAEIIDFNFQREVGLLLNNGGVGEEGTERNVSRDQDIFYGVLSYSKVVKNY